MIRRWISSITTHFTDPWWRRGLLTLYYLAVLLALAALHGKGSFVTPGFIYQAF